MRLSLAALCSLAILFTVSEGVAGSLEDLMESLSAVEERRASFVEERTLGILDGSLITEGTLAYEAPNRLYRQDLLPDPALYALEGDQLRILIDGQERTLALDQEPLIEAMVAPFRAVFAGDLETLERIFDLDYADGQDEWVLTMRPKPETPGYRVIESITVLGTAGRIARVETEERDGDRTVMRLETSPEQASDDG